MIDSLPTPHDSPLSRYSVDQLHYALTQDTGKPAPLAFDVHALSGAPSPALLHTPHSSDAETDYTDSRRMSSSAASDSSLHSKRRYDYSPSASPVPAKDAAQPWASPQHTPAATAATDDDARSELSSHSPRVQLPSIASTFQDRHELRRASLPSTLHDPSGSGHLRLPTPTASLHRTSQSHPGLASYQFPAPSPPDSDHAPEDSRRPRLTALTQIPPYQGEYPVPSSAFSGSSSLSFGTSPLSGATSVSDDSWAPGISRPASTPSRPPAAAGSPSLKYSDDRGALYAGVTRISGQHPAAAAADRARIVKTEGDQWGSFGSTEYGGMSPANAPSGLVGAGAPAISVTGSPTRSPQQPHAPPPSLVERAPRKRGKLPKPVTDYLKDWLHRHSDHPYPSEEEKKALCNATGLSMSQVSNWMINARRRILAPAHRAAASPQTNMPYSAPASRPSLLDGGRRASMPADGLTLYHPMSLQSLPEYALGSSTRHMVGMARSLSSSHGLASAHASHHHHPYALDASYTRLPYGAGGALHPSAHVGGSGGGGGGAGAYLGVPLSAPASMSSPSPFGGYQGSYSRVSSEGAGQGSYAFAEHAHSVSPQPGSGYTTPH
ncbi:homeobox domain-containing protein [Phanerochaete sordida]|uniref:Homeobox domain-containing protein n=1 Tax=Phanerochaete sordida TaxID=48140 RepID=A0A9P3GBF5_9APHY|nr:homeobox domain-containing protein [Phanerochaete sordida]